MLRKIIIPGFENSVQRVQDIPVYFQLFGPDLGTAPVVLVNHSLTGNSKVTGRHGWWQELVGPGKAIDLNRFTVLSINVPGNGAGGKMDFLDNYAEFTLADIAAIFLKLLQKLEVRKLYAVIGGSIGGALAWELAAQQPDLAEYIIPIAADLKTTDWVLAQCKVQEQILNNSVDPVHDARMHAMTFYRTPASLAGKFRRKKEVVNGHFEVNNWLLYHGTKLKERFPLSAYKLMNHLLTTIDIGRGSTDYLHTAAGIKGVVHMIAIDSDLFFTAEENRKDYRELLIIKEKVAYSEISSLHGHDAFLLEFEQLENILKPIFKQEKFQKNETDSHSTIWNR